MRHERQGWQGARHDRAATSCGQRTAETTAICAGTVLRAISNDVSLEGVGLFLYSPSAGTVADETELDLAIRGLGQGGVLRGISLRVAHQLHKFPLHGCFLVFKCDRFATAMSMGARTLLITYLSGDEHTVCACNTSTCTIVEVLVRASRPNIITIMGQHSVITVLWGQLRKVVAWEKVSKGRIRSAS